jgi:predicted ATP-grasp superfamily ATP-dependent carboligase
VAKALRQAGHSVAVVCEDRISYGAWSRYPHKRIFGPSCAREPEQYAKFLLELLQRDSYDVLIPLFDYSAEIVSRFKAKLSNHAHIPIVDYDVFNLAHDKKKTMEVCRKEGLPHPSTYDPLSESLDAISRKVGFPCLIKPNVGHGAIGIQLVESVLQLDKKYRETRQQFGPCTIQEFIPHNGMQYKVQVFMGPHGKIHAAVVFNKIRYFPVSGGTSSLNVTVHKPEIIKTCCRLLKAMGWQSYADIDLIEDTRDGNAKVMEINPRVTGSIKIAFEAGVDFADLLVRYALGHDLPVYESYRLGVQMRYMPLDVLWFLYSPDRLKSNPSWFRFWGSDLCYQEGSLEDPLPILAAYLSGIKKYLDPSFRKSKLSNKGSITH